MIAPSLYADLKLRGVRLSVAETPKAGELLPLRLRVQAPEGALTPALTDALRRHRDALLEYVFDLEERAAVLEYEQGNARADAELFARACVVGGSAGPDGRLWLRDCAEHHPMIEAVRAVYPDLEVISVWRAEADVEERREEAA
jgi:TubC N-terminal docking domain